MGDTHLCVAGSSQLSGDKSQTSFSAEAKAVKNKCPALESAQGVC